MTVENIINDQELNDQVSLLKLDIAAFKSTHGTDPKFLFVSDLDDNQSTIMWAGTLLGLAVKRTDKKTHLK